jgi:hypothetical protein
MTRTATLSTGPVVLGTVRDQLVALPRADALAAARDARHAVTTVDRRRTLTALAVSFGMAGALLLAAGLGALAARRKRLGATPQSPASDLVAS